jgi:hypothetical protein
MEALYHIIKEMVYTLKKSGSAIAKQKEENVITGQKKNLWLDVMEKIKQKKATTKDLFHLVDSENGYFFNFIFLLDSSGGISLYEFDGLMKRLNKPMSEHRIIEIFARVKMNSKQSKAEVEGELDVNEFEIALNYMNEKTQQNALQSLKLDFASLFKIFLFMLLILGLLFLFIFLGIQAFSIKGTVGSIVNSMMPVGRRYKITLSNFC